MQLNSSRILASGVGLVVMVSLALLLWGQEPSSSQPRISLPQDWSHRHVVFSNPTTLEQSLRVKQDARFWHQWYRRNVRQVVPAEESAFDESREPDENLPWVDGDWVGWFGWFHRRHRAPPPRNLLKRDWAISLGPNATLGAGNYPAKFSFDITTANCASAAQPDFVVFNTSVATSSQASIVAYDNLYSSCGGVAVPSTYWSYNTGGSVVTSVTLSLDGSQVAFIQTPTTVPIANLVLLKWKPTADFATSTSPDSITIAATASLYPTCPAPCMTTLPFSGLANDTNSSPFYDYSNDALYVGDNSGALHKFHPVFGPGTPAEVGSPWPVVLGSGANKLDSPVLDSVTGRVFVGTLFNGSSGAQLFAVDSSAGTIVGTSSPLGVGNGILDGPVVDSSAGKVYVFVGSDNSTASSTCFQGGHPCAAVYQFATSFSSGLGIEAKVSTGGNGTGTFTMYLGAFDNAYYTSPNSTGTLYVCGNIRGIGAPFRIPVNAGVMSTASLGGFSFGSVAAPGSLPCGPLTEIFNSNQNSGANSGGPAGTDKVFLSTVGPGTTNPCFNNGTGGCILDLPITAWRPGTIYSLGQEILDTNLNIQVVTAGGTSGSTQPTWPSPGAGGSIFTLDGGVQWVVKEGLGITGTLSWTANTGEPQGLFILDPNGNIEVVTSNSGTTGLVQPVWPMTIGVQTMDGTVHWVNAGPVDNFFLPVGEGTSGIILDNIVPTGTLAGGSQVYFTPLSLGFSTCGATNGCAVQASQAGLK
jgi:hypothetical protein